MATASERTANAIVRRDLDLLKVARGARKATIAKIDALARQLQELIYKVDPTGPVQMRHRELRVKRLLEEAQGLIKQAYSEIAQEHRVQSKTLAGLEGQAALAAINKGVGATVAVVRLTRSQIAAIGNDAVITGTPLKEWWANQSASAYKRFAAAMRKGFQAGETVQQMAKRVNETRGFLEIERYQAEALARTGFQSVTNEARRITAENNQDVIKGVAPRITFDLRTCVVCMAYSNTWYSVEDYEPQTDGAPPWNGGPPWHPGCRCSMTYVLKSWQELSGKRLQGGQGLPQQALRTRFEDSLRRQGMSQAQIDRAVENAKASMDGQIPEDLTFEEWLRKKDPGQQKEVLGAARWQLWQDGKFDLADFATSSGRILTLEELAARS